jgi:hypothetical protein
LERLCSSDIAEACGRLPQGAPFLTTLNWFWRKWSDYAAICANMRAAACEDISD